MSDSLLFSNLQEVEMGGKWRNEKHINNFKWKTQRGCNIWQPSYEDSIKMDNKEVVRAMPSTGLGQGNQNKFSQKVGSFLNNRVSTSLSNRLCSVRLVNWTYFCWQDYVDIGELCCSIHRCRRDKNEIFDRLVIVRFAHHHKIVHKLHKESKESEQISETKIMTK